MKEEILKETVADIKESIADIRSSLKDRMKLPILLAYCIILIIYNWDVLFYFIVENDTAKEKIEYINDNFKNTYFHRFLCPLIFAIVSTFIFPVLQVGINYFFQWFKNQNKELIRKDEEDNVIQEKKLLDLRSENKDNKELQAEIKSKDELISQYQSEVSHLKIQNDKTQKERITELNSIKIKHAYLLDMINKSIDTNKITSTMFDVFRFKETYSFFESLNINKKEIALNMLNILEDTNSASIETLSRRLNMNVEKFLNYNDLLDQLVLKNLISITVDRNKLKIINKTLLGSEFINIYNALNQ